MAQKTDSALQTDRGVIESETTAGANTAVRVGNHFEDIIDSKINNDKIIDEDNMASDSSIHVPTQQSVKAYVDAAAASGGHTIEDEDTPLTQRTKLNFVGGGVTVTDDAGDDASVVTIPGLTGAQDLFIPAAAMWPRASNGCSTLTPVEMATSQLTIQTLDFDQSADEYAQFHFSPPRNYNNGTIVVTVYWTATAGSGTVQWEVSAGAYSNDDPLTGAFGTAVVIDDTLIAANDLHISPTSSAMTIAGTPADGDLIGIQIMRDVSDDTLTADAKLIGIRITLTLDASISE